MLVKCAHCKDTKIDKDMAYKVIVKGKNKYYCSKAEYDEECKEKVNKDKIYELVTNIFGYKVQNSAFFKEQKDWANIATNEKIASYIEENTDYLSNIMQREFSSEYGKIRYFSTIIKNNLVDYKIKPKEEVKRETNFEFYEISCKPKRGRRGLSALEELYDD